MYIDERIMSSVNNYIKKVYPEKKKLRSSNIEKMMVMLHHLPPTKIITCT